MIQTPVWLTVEGNNILGCTGWDCVCVCGPCGLQRYVS